MGKVPEEVIAEIRDRVDLVELIGGYLTLKRSGKNHLGLCPFHQEKTPSFNVNPDRQMYHCFGCGVSGDAFKFLMEHDHLSFPEALHNLADRVGIDLSKYERQGPAGGSEFDLLYRAHAIAVRLFRETLKRDEGRAAREELHRRGISDAIGEEYRVGASADAWDRLLKVCAREGIRPPVLERAGLAIRRDSGTGHYDRFRGRLMFPIETVGGKVIGFGGRVLGEGDPKYLNSPESPLFQKRRTLYGFPQAKSSIRETREATLVEGYTDVLALANAGIGGALASLGTAFTAEHAAFLMRSCDKVTVLFDGDEAGRKAAYGSCGPLLGAGLEVRMVMLPPGEDPDSLLRKEGAEVFRERMAGGKGVVETLLGDEPYYEGGAAQERAVRRVLKVLTPIQDPVRRRAYLEELAITAGVRGGLPEEMLEAELAELRKKESVAGHRAATREQTQVPRAARVVSERPSAVERTFAAIILHDAELGTRLLEKFGPGDFEHPLVRRVVERASEMVADGQLPEAHVLMGAFEGDAALLDFIGELTVSGQYSVAIERQAGDCLARLERRGLEREMDEVMREMRMAKAKGDEALVLDCARKTSELAKGIALLSTPRDSM